MKKWPTKPLAEQRRLVARIEAQTAHLTQTRQAREEASVEARQVKQVV
jgi:hypothetical protein